MWSYDSLCEIVNFDFLYILTLQWSAGLGRSRSGTKPTDDDDDDDDGGGHPYRPGGAAYPDAFGDARSSSADWCYRRTAGRDIHTTQHVHLPTSHSAARQNPKSSTSASC